jgi:hypothetical protein
MKNHIGVVVKGSFLVMVVTPVKFPLHMVFTKKDAIIQKVPSLSRPTLWLSQFYQDHIEMVHS